MTTKKRTITASASADGCRRKIKVVCRNDSKMRRLVREGRVQHDPTRAAARSRTLVRRLKTSRSIVDFLAAMMYSGPKRI